MSKLPEGWSEVRLGDCLRQKKGKVDPAKFADLPYLGMDDIESGTGRILSHSRGGDFKSQCAQYECGDLLYGRLRPYLNKVTRAPFVGLASAELLVYETTGAIDPNYALIILRSPAFLEFANRESTGDRPRLSPEKLAEFPILLPPLAEQRRIVGRLGSLMVGSHAAVAGLARIEGLISRYKIAALGAVFKGSIVGHETDEGVSVDEVAVTIFDGPFGSNLKSADYSETGERVIRLENIGHLEFLGDKKTYIPVEKFEGLSRHELQIGDIIFSSFIADQIRVCRLPDLDGERAINKADCFCIRVDEQIVQSRFLELMLASPASYRALEKLVHGATRPRINTAQLKSLRFVLPSIDEQSEIVASIENAFAEIEILTRAVALARARLETLDRAILARAFRGDLVPQDPNDEPAGELLKRVTAKSPVNEEKDEPSRRKSKRMPTAAKQLEEALINWPKAGLTFEELQFKLSAPYDDIRDAIFELLGGDNPVLRQSFDTKAATMRLLKVTL